MINKETLIVEKKVNWLDNEFVLLFQSKEASEETDRIMQESDRKDVEASISMMKKTPNGIFGVKEEFPFIIRQ